MKGNEYRKQLNVGFCVKTPTSIYNSCSGKTEKHITIQSSPLCYEGLSDGEKLIWQQVENSDCSEEKKRMYKEFALLSAGEIDLFKQTVFNYIKDEKDVVVSLFTYPGTAKLTDFNVTMIMNELFWKRKFNVRYATWFYRTNGNIRCSFGDEIKRSNHYLRIRTMIVLMSTKHIPRISAKSELSKLPNELIRMINDF